MMKRLIVALCVAGSASGCYQPPPQAEIMQAGRRNLLPYEKAFIARAVSLNLKDPDSAKFLWLPLVAHRRGYIYDYCLFVNAKNSYGGYEGFGKVYVQLFFEQHGRLTSAEERLMSEFGNDVSTDATESVCAGFGYGQSVFAATP